MNKGTIKTILVDLDQILVDMVPKWLECYYKTTGERIKEKDITNFEIRHFVKYPNVLDALLEKDGFFFNMSPMPNSLKYLKKIKDLEIEIIILTQPPRKADYAIKDKRKWMLKYFPWFDASNMIFAHKKHLIRGDLLFDDNPEHLKKWKAVNKKSMTATIDYPYNRDAKVNLRLTKQNAWKSLYNFLKSNKVDI